MTGENTFSTASGIFKKVYDTVVRDYRPLSAATYNLLPFDSAKKVGDSYNVAVVLQPPNGATYGGAAGDLITFEAARNMVIKQATLQAFSWYLREQIVFEVFSRAVSQGEAAFKSATSEVVLGMTRAGKNRINASILHGQRGYGTIESVTDLGSNTASVVISQATFAPGMWWAINTNSTWDTFASTTKMNSGGALVLTGINSRTRTLTMTYTGAFGTQLVAAQVLYPRNAWDGTTHRDMPGLLSQAGNTTGTSLGLSATTYPNWAANTYDVAGPFGYWVVEDAISQLRDRGIDGKIVVILPNKAYSQCVVELMQAGFIDSRYNDTKQKQGTKAVEYESKDVGTVRLVNDGMMKLGEALIIPVGDDKVTCRIGSTDLTFNLPGKGGEIFTYLPDNNAAQMVCMSDQAVICKRPQAAMLMTGITYPASA